jgi:hypothetical protein
LRIYWGVDLLGNGDCARPIPNKSSIDSRQSEINPQSPVPNPQFFLSA